MAQVRLRENEQAIDGAYSNDILSTTRNNIISKMMYTKH